MILSGIIVQFGSPVPLIILENDSDRIVNCTIVDGEIVTKGPCWFSRCLMEKTNLAKNLAEIPPKPLPLIDGCIFKSTKLPDAHYTRCYFDGVQR